MQTSLSVGRGEKRRALGPVLLCPSGLVTTLASSGYNTVLRGTEEPALVRASSLPFPLSRRSAWARQNQTG